MTIANRWAILFIFGSFFAIVFTFQLILSYRLQRTCGLGLNFILSWSCSQIFIFYLFMGRQLLNLVRMTKYENMVFGSFLPYPDNKLFTSSGDHELQVEHQKYCYGASLGDFA